MNKTGLCAHVASQNDIPKALAASAVYAVFSAIGGELAAGRAVSTLGFGTFSVKSRQARQRRNPQTGQAMTIAVARIPTFKAGRGLRQALN